MDTTDAKTEGPAEEAPREEAPTCVAELGGQVCSIGAGHEDPAHPEHLVDAFGEIMHAAPDVRWPVDAEGCKKRNAERRAAILDKIKNTPPLED